MAARPKPCGFGDGLRGAGPSNLSELHRNGRRSTESGADARRNDIRLILEEEVLRLSKLDHLDVAKGCAEASRNLLSPEAGVAHWIGDEYALVLLSHHGLARYVIGRGVPAFTDTSGGMKEE